MKTHKYLYEEGDSSDEPSTELTPSLSGVDTRSTQNNLELGLLANDTMAEEQGSKNPVHASKSDRPASLERQASSNPLYGVSKDAAGDVVENKEEEEEEEVDLLGYSYSLVWLAVITVFIAFLSDAISASIQDAADSAGISGIFLAAVVLPIVGNAAEHAGAVMFAMKDKLDLSLGVAIGSSTQIALLVLPLLVLLGWMMDKDMNLNFGAFESATLFLAVVSVTFAIKDGTSNWLVGLTLCAMYIVIAAGFWAHNNDSLSS